MFFLRIEAINKGVTRRLLCFRVCNFLPLNIDTARRGQLAKNNRLKHLVDHNRMVCLHLIASFVTLLVPHRISLLGYVKVALFVDRMNQASNWLMLSCDKLINVATGQLFN